MPAFACDQPASSFCSAATNRRVLPVPGPARTTLMRAGSSTIAFCSGLSLSSQGMVDRLDQVRGDREVVHRNFVMVLLVFLLKECGERLCERSLLLALVGD